MKQVSGKKKKIQSLPLDLSWLEESYDAFDALFEAWVIAIDLASKIQLLDFLNFLKI